jgi:hypothetical protein
MTELSPKHPSAICYLCGRKSSKENPLTSDHIFPKGLFPPPRPKNLITLPCCKECHDQYAKDDEYFRNVIATDHRIFMHPEGTKLWPRVLQSLRNGPFFRKHFLSLLKEIEVVTPEGLYLGKATTIKPDMKRLKRVLKRTAWGLHYFHSGSFADNHEVVVYLEPKESGKISTDLLPSCSIFDKLGAAVMYRGGFSNDSPSSAWFVAFFDRILAIMFVVEKRVLPTK